MSMSSLSSLSDEDARTSRRNLPPVLNAFEKYDEVDFRRRFRLSKDTVIYLTQIIGENIRSKTRRNRAIEPIDQILITLRFFATGTFQRVLGDLFHVQQATVHRIVHRVSAQIAALKPLYIYMPRTTAEQQETVNNFYTIAGFPRVLGAIDCTHIKTTSPGGANAELFRNRKGYFSLNVQMVCDSTLKIRNIVARWPGSVHDSTIFSDSPLCADFERRDFGNYVLLGDSGYPCRSYLLTPLLNPRTPAEERYNQAQISTRNPVERLYGVLKRRFPCLQVGLGVDMERIPAIIVACAVLHNIALNRNDEALENDSDDESGNILAPDIMDDENSQNMDNANFAVRNSIIQTYFS